MRPRRNERRHAVEPCRIRVRVGADIDAAATRRSRSSRRSAACVPSCGLPAAFRCQISTGMLASRPMRTASSIAVDRSRRLPTRMCVAYTPPYLDASARQRDNLLGAWRRAQARTADEVETPTAPSCMASRTSALHALQLIRGGLLVGIAQHHASHLGGAHVAGEINPDPLLFQPREILPASVRQSGVSL